MVVCGRQQPDDLPTHGGRSASFIACDVREAQAVQALVDEVHARHGRLDVLVNNAGGAPAADAATVSPRFHESVLRLNLFSTLHASQAANAVMQRQPGGGVIVCIGSVSALRPSPGTAAYGAAKAAVLNLVGSLAVEWAPGACGGREPRPGAHRAVPPALWRWRRPGRRGANHSGWPPGRA